MSQVDTGDPRFKIKLVPAEEVLKRIPRDVLIVKIVDLHRRLTGGIPLLPGDITKMDMEAIRKEYYELPKGDGTVTILFGVSE